MAPLLPTPSLPNNQRARLPTRGPHPINSVLGSPCQSEPHLPLRNMGVEGLVMMGASGTTRAGWQGSPLAQLASAGPSLVVALAQCQWWLVVNGCQTLSAATARVWRQAATNGCHSRGWGRWPIIADTLHRHAAIFTRTPASRLERG
ncbi:uncharacterized protein CANTADRAFT_26260 [Suhomyces tanzawaensis NRRL Y-17324]|uniref:Uncharacterized protein n=1 Tax=Suhomyces tanzawaensis NRRL Y-17324 TaxID=984487 RepID=A0A1E4SIF5_9ASCO|nr:uncharacterized protein CANTADRAFT_26260 [Suhomyces tanzawaensis NRRL Y-17324]ODV79284.1 hypothetical protein CANTADRAFT_26260 [Suhomyces tanzawaensis NRRL Y-17324]